jgi:tetratricopeptide (TPR) repeat protein
MEDRDYILFEDYLSQSLSKNEREAFEVRLNEDDSFKEAFELYKSTSSFLEHKFSNIKEREAFKENLSRISKKQLTTSEAHSKKTSYFKPWKMAVAASLLVIFGVFYSQWFSTPTYRDYADYPQISLKTRGISDQIITKAEIAFNSKNYEEAISLFKALPDKESENFEIKLYLAVSLVEVNSFSEADAIFQTLLNKPTAYLNQARWYAALSRLKQKKYDESESLLELIPEDSEEYTKAQKLLQKLD